MKILLTIPGINIPVYSTDDESILWWLATSNVDDDGSGPSLGDPCFQGNTTYQPPLNAEKVPFAVIPRSVALNVGPRVIGCGGHAFNAKTGLWTPIVIGDTGPANKIGEFSVLTNQRLGVNPNPVSGGDQDWCICCRITPGVAAVIDGVTYELQSLT
jgi:hypothetical protein